LYLVLPGPLLPLAVTVGLVAFAGGNVLYLMQRPAARRLVWPDPQAG
jgi:hypothetical protein